DEALEPGQLVVELRAGLRIAVRQIEARNHETIDRRFDVAALLVGGVSGQLAAQLHRGVLPSQDRPAVPGALALPDRFVAGRSQLVDREGRVLRLELLEAHYVRPLALQPLQEIRQSAADSVDVVGGDLHGGGSLHCRYRGARVARTDTGSAPRSTQLAQARFGGLRCARWATRPFLTESPETVRLACRSPARLAPLVYG